MRGRGHWCVVIVALLAAAAACSGDDDSSGGDPEQAGLGSIVAGLRALPPGDGGDGPAQWVWGDLQKAAELAGATRPSDPGDRQAVMGYLLALTGVRVAAGEVAAVALMPPEAAHIERSADLAAFTADVGWNVLQVDRFVERGTPPGVVTVLEGDFAEGSLTEALGEPRDGTWRAGSGEGYSVNVGDISAARPLGEALWLALDGARLSITRSAEDAGAARRAQSGEEGASAADDPDLVAVARTLDARSPYGAMIVQPALTLDAAVLRTPEQFAAQCERSSAPRARSVGTGIADDGGPVILVASTYASAADAATAADAIEELVTTGASLATRQPWSELVSLDGVDVIEPDHAVLARLRPTGDGRPSLWHQVMLQRDSLVATC